jgi:hypothetical protein
MSLSSFTCGRDEPAIMVSKVFPNHVIGPDSSGVEVAGNRTAEAAGDWGLTSFDVADQLDSAAIGVEPLIV